MNKIAQRDTTPVELATELSQVGATKTGLLMRHDLSGLEAILVREGGNGAAE
jgi:hypothetical protein